MALVRLYGSPMSTNALRVLVCLEEVCAKYEVVNIDFSTLEHKSPAHFARNPFGQVPAFEDGDLKLFESRAISKYVLRKYKSSSGVDLLREGDVKEAALVELWSDVEAHQFNPVINPIFYQKVIVPFKKGTPNQKVIDENVDKLNKVLDVYDKRLSESKYLAGDFISFADLSHIPLTNQIMKTTYASLFESRFHVKAWWESILARPAVKKLLSQ